MKQGHQIRDIVKKNNISLLVLYGTYVFIDGFVERDLVLTNLIDRHTVRDEALMSFVLSQMQHTKNFRAGPERLAGYHFFDQTRPDITVSYLIEMCVNVLSKHTSQQLMISTPLEKNENSYKQPKTYVHRNARVKMPRNIFFSRSDATKLSHIAGDQQEHNDAIYVSTVIPEPELLTNLELESSGVIGKETTGVHLRNVLADDGNEKRGDDEVILDTPEDPEPDTIFSRL